jgi:antirestriction protein ArdC
MAAKRTDKAKEMLVQQVADLLATGDVGEWMKPWTSYAMLAPRNATSKHRYTGGNAFLFHMVAYANGWVGEFATYKQWESKGCQVRKGETGLPGIFVKSIVVKDETAPKGKKSILISKGFTVFAAEQVDGDFAAGAITARSEPTTTDREQDEAASELAARLIAMAPGKVFTANAAYYIPSADTVHLPAQDTFTSDVEYASTVAHEFTHWTGHTSRAGRFSKDAPAIDGVDGVKEEYAFEELVAELGSVFLLAGHGVSAAAQPNSAAYLGHWLKRLNGDPDFLWHAASAAQKAVAIIDTALAAVAVPEMAVAA